MTWQSNGYTYALFATAVIAAAMSSAAWKRRPKAGAVPLAATMLGLFIWSLAQALEIASVEVTGKIFWSKIQYVGIVIVPTAWLMLALEYTGLGAEWLRPRNKWLFLIHPVLTVVVVWTNDLHHWIWAEVTTVRFGDLWMWKASYGIGFWIHTAYSYMLLLVGLLLLIYLAISSPPPYRNQTLILLSGAVVPWLANALSIFDIIHTPVNITGFAFTLAGVVAFWGLFRYQLLDLVPVARDVVVDSMQDAMIAMNLEGRVVDVNATSAKLLQRPSSDILGRTLSDLMPACPAWMVDVAHLAEVHQETSLTWGEESRWYDVRISPLYDARRHIHGHIVLLHDISERKQLEASFEAQIEQQTTLFEVLRSLQHPMTLQHAAKEAVEVIAQLTEWPVVGLLTVEANNHLSLNTFAGQLSPQWVHSLRTKADSISQNATTSSQSLFDLEMIQDQDYPSLLLVPLKGNRQRILLVADDVPQAFDEEARLLANSLGNVVALVLRNAQLYERVSSEQRRLSALVHSSQDGILMLSPDGHILVMSQQAMRYLSLPGTPQDWLGRSMIKALSYLRAYAPEAVQATLSETRRISSGETTPGEGEYQIKGRVIRWFNVPVVAEDQSLGRLLILHDVTEERQVAQMREDLTYTMVHDLRNPLTSIHSSIWLLRKQLQHTIPTNYRTLLEIAQRSTTRLLDLVTAILDISRLEGGHMPLDCGPFSLPDLATEILELQSPLAQEKQIALLQEHATQLPDVNADRNLIGRVLQNLIGNALKFTPDGGEVKVCTCHISDEGSPKVQLSIRDTGPGILPEIRDRLFEKFVTGQQTGHGSGLGLTFCKMVLEAHDERIWVESSPGEGTEFSFTLPPISLAEETA